LLEDWCISGNGIGVCGSARVAGAIDYVAWNNRQFINTADHGGELQIAISNEHGECYNPTEAGSLNDGAGEKTTSRLEGVNTAGNVYRTTTLPAFWLAPGQKDQDGCIAVNTSPLSNYKTSKAITIGAYGIWNALQYLITVVSPENQAYLQIEAPTGYMPSQFSSFWLINLDNGQLQPVNQGPAETTQPVIIGTPDEKFAMGAYLAAAPVAYAHYARFYFPGSDPYATSKWSIVWRTWNGVTPGQNLSFSSTICVGNLTNVQTCMVQAAQKTGYVHCSIPQC